MLSFFKKNKKEIPNWSPFQDYKTHELFENHVKNYFKVKGIQCELNDGIVKIPNNDFGLNNLGLQNIAQFCFNEGVDKFQQHITGHFETLIRGHQFNQEFDAIKEDFDRVKQYLGVRIYNKSYIDQVGIDKTIGKHLDGDLYAMLVYDLPDTVKSVPPKEAEKWKKSEEDLWNFSLKQITAKYPPNIMERELEGLKFKTIEEDHFYSPNIIMHIDEFDELIGIHGSLISMPTRHIVIIYPINDLSAANAINTQLKVTFSVSAKGPGTVSNNVFWYHDGIIENQVYRVEDGKISFTPTENFVAMLNQFQA